MSVVRAKFFVSEIRFTSWGGGVTLQAVCRGEDNKEWASATPTGTITMGISNALALDTFKPGDEYFVDFTPAIKGQPGMTGNTD